MAFAFTKYNHDVDEHVNTQWENSSTDLQYMCDCRSAGLLWLQAGCQTEDRSGGCGRVFPGSGERRWHCWLWAGSGCAAAGQSRLDRTNRARGQRIKIWIVTQTPFKMLFHEDFPKKDGGDGEKSYSFLKWECNSHLKWLRLLVQTWGRRRLCPGCGRSPHKPEHTAEAPKRPGLAQSGPGAAGCAVGPNEVPPCRTCLGTHKLGGRGVNIEAYMCNCNLIKGPLSRVLHMYWTSQKGVPINNNDQVCGCRVPVGACSAELGMVALSRGTVLVSGSGVLLVGDVGTGLGTTRGFLWIQTHTFRHFTAFVSFLVQYHQYIWWEQFIIQHQMWLLHCTLLSFSYLNS